MRKKNPSPGPVALLPRWRVLCEGETALGPGRVDLLEHIGETGSLQSAAARMGMSYMRAWTIVKSLNRSFAMPLVEATRGGKAGGGAALTKTGKEVIGHYRRLEKESQQAVRKIWARLRKLLKSRKQR